MTVNGSTQEHDVEPRLLLVYYLREVLGLTGTKIGCDTSSCGACTVLLNGESVKSCTMFAVQADGADITTIEGLATDGEFHPMQQAFHENHGLQCGYCTAGHGDGRGVAARGAARTRPRPTCGRASRATSAAAPATTTSSRRSSPPPGQGVSA